MRKETLNTHSYTQIFFSFFSPKTPLPNSEVDGKGDGGWRLGGGGEGWEKEANENTPRPFAFLIYFRSPPPLSFFLSSFPSVFLSFCLPFMVVGFEALVVRLSLCLFICLFYFSCHTVLL